MKWDICTFVVECDICQRNKGERFNAPDTLQPLPILPTLWTYIYMDFIVGLPKSENKSLIMVVVDCLSKYAHLCALQHPFTTSTMAQIFMDNIFKLHSMPHSIIFDCDPTFTNTFGKNFSDSREPNCISEQHIILKLMDKLKRSTSVWKSI
jgi:hypothetical protein